MNKNIQKITSLNWCLLTLNCIMILYFVYFFGYQYGLFELGYMSGVKDANELHGIEIENFLKEIEEFHHAKFVVKLLLLKKKLNRQIYL